LENWFPIQRKEAYPNPSSDEISLDLPQELEFEVYLIDLRNGTKYGFQTKQTSGGVISIGNIPNGEYLIVVNHDGKPVAEQKLIIQRK
jgi:hypothetical protein